jgi:ubiquitin-conjugating enzyme E2 variant
VLDVCFCGGYACFAALFAIELWRGAGASWILLTAAAFAACVAADFCSGLVHWAADTYCSEETPWIGAKLIAPFREHHRDPRAITRHDFWEANGDNCLLGLGVLVPGYLWLPHGEASWAVVVGFFLLALSLLVLLTSLAHGWAHMDRPPWFARLLQRVRLAIRREHHEQHHVAPHRTHYCVTMGWLNPILDRVRFFRTLERVLAQVGVVPASAERRVAPCTARPSLER